MMTGPMASLMAMVGHQLRAKFERQIQQPERVQAAFLQTLLRTHQDTILGREFDLAGIKTVSQFRQQVPIWPYANYEPYMNRVAAGEANVVTPDPVIYLNFTSGSTGKRKLIPVTQRSRRYRNQVSTVSMGYAIAAMAARQQSVGKLLVTSSVELEGVTDAGIPYGPVSVGDLRSSSWLKRALMAHPFMALEPSDSLARHYVCLLFALANPNLKMIGANFPVLAIKLCEYLEDHADSLLTDLEQGTLAHWLPLEERLRSHLTARLHPQPDRAAHLRQLYQQTGRFTPQQIWPHLAFVVTARGGTSSFYLQRFPEYFGDTPVFGGIYASAEAAFGSYTRFNDDGAVLAVDSGFYEFIPPEQWDAQQPQTLLAHQVQVGERYRVLVTNYNGFYRYDIGDVVEVVGHKGQTPILTFRHRRGGLLSSTTEKTTEYHVTQVMQALQTEFNLSLENFCVTLAREGVPPPYLVNVELVNGNAIANPQAFLRRFDEQLQSIHTSYAVKRRTAVPPPQLRILEPGSFATVRQRLIEQGTPESHLKFPHINEDRKFLTDLPVALAIQLPAQDP